MPQNRDLESLGKEELELEKLRAEIREKAVHEELDKKRAAAEIENLSRPEFLKPAFYAALAPSALGIMGLLFSWQSGYFDVQQKKLEADKTLLEYETGILESNRTELEGQVAAFEEDRDRLQEEALGLRQQLKSMKADRGQLESSLALFVDATGIAVEDLREVPDIDGAVLGFPEAGMVKLNVGREDGVNNTHVFHVFDKAHYKGSVRVTTVEDGMSIAKIIRSVEERTIVVGDSASTRL